MYDYGVSPYSYDTIDSMLETQEIAAAGAMGMAAGISVVYMIFAWAIAIFSIVCMWKVFAKAGKPGWASLIPIYNMVVMFQIAGMSPWMLLLMLLPIANIIVAIMLYINFAKAFGKSGGFACGLIFLNPIFMAILAFDKSEYVA